MTKPFATRYTSTVPVESLGMDQGDNIDLVMDGEGTYAVLMRLKTERVSREIIRCLLLGYLTAELLPEVPAPFDSLDQCPCCIDDGCSPDGERGHLLGFEDGFDTVMRYITRTDPKPENRKGPAWEAWTAMWDAGFCMGKRPAKTAVRLVG